MATSSDATTPAAAVAPATPAVPVTEAPAAAAAHEGSKPPPVEEDDADADSDIEDITKLPKDAAQKVFRKLKEANQKIRDKFMKLKSKEYEELVHNILINANDQPKEWHDAVRAEVKQSMRRDQNPATITALASVAKKCEANRVNYEEAKQNYSKEVELRKDAEKRLSELIAAKPEGGDSRVVKSELRHKSLYKFSDLFDEAEARAVNAVELMQNSKAAAPAAAAAAPAAKQESTHKKIRLDWDDIVAGAQSQVQSKCSFTDYTA